MTKEVLVSVSGLQFAVNSDEVIEVITGGQYFNRGGKQYVLYDEMIEEDIRIVVDYALDINYEFISDCVITIVVKAKQNAELALSERN